MARREKKPVHNVQMTDDSCIVCSPMLQYKKLVYIGER